MGSRVKLDFVILMGPFQCEMFYELGFLNRP